LNRFAIAVQGMPRRAAMGNESGTRGEQCAQVQGRAAHTLDPVAIRWRVMAERKPTPRSTLVLAGVVGGGLLAVVIGQRFSRWVLESQEHTIIAVALGAVIGGVIAWFATRNRARS
jgi:hypothetical protein